MSWNPPPPLLALPTELSDETVAQLLECLYELARSLESHYAGQPHRYYHPGDERQQPLWSDDPPFCPPPPQHRFGQPSPPPSSTACWIMLRQLRLKAKAFE